MIDTDPAVTGALVKSVHALDASRRVGWAKAYSATSKLDEALRESNLFRGDRDAYRNGISFLHGLFIRLAEEGGRGGAWLTEAIARHMTPDQLLDSVLVSKGRAEGERIIRADETYQEEASIARASQSRKAVRGPRKTTIQPRRADRKIYGERVARFERRRVAGSFGFPSVEAMYTVLRKWQIATKTKRVPAHRVTIGGLTHEAELRGRQFMIDNPTADPDRWAIRDEDIS